MSYEKQTWVTGEIVTADKLNHMEDGIADSGGVQHAFIKVCKDNTLRDVSVEVFLLYATLDTINNKTRWNIYPTDSTQLLIANDAVFREYLPIPPEDNRILCLAIFDQQDWKVNIDGMAELSDIDGSVQDYPYQSWFSAGFDIYHIYGDCTLEVVLDD